MRQGKGLSPELLETAKPENDSEEPMADLFGLDSIF